MLSLHADCKTFFQHTYSTKVTDVALYKTLLTGIIFISGDTNH